ncbi:MULTISPECIES: sigma-54-dependent transcriptional regulator [Lysobacter]|uniref:Sigma-54 dependent transcriptional regulator n=1 Tax=Lysobacter yananisis TaxID=1003114 RepID=A0ABY9PIF4_9GAMM|nr:MULTISPECIES: sigma-54 dependent transcriptional regulator [Lysobacter]QQQ02457.1 sigma-54-dependent Fis family transcriptional regulator [Lysobacter enzymogenes]WMT05607.1 sigma-54 dependent transcriptional regulator [Lysobacter yananisis]
MAETRSALVVDDERDIRELLVMTLGRMGLRCDTASGLNEARSQLLRNRYDLCLTDMRLPDGSGMDLVAEISQKHPNTPVAMITAFGNVEAAVEALKAGAFDFVAKPVDLSVLRDLVRHALELHETRRSASEAVGSRLYGESPAMIKLRQTIGKVARSQAPVYIAGESGVGKELVARTIHSEGGRADGPFVPVNCGAIPAELMESEFFGHKKGSFTGAHADKPGLFQAADGGTLFLDEVAELPLAMQVKLLRAIQEKSIRPVGAQAEVTVDVRILSATHKDLAALVAEGRFRQDLYYRINVIELRVPPLRERLDDLPGLAAKILHRLAGNQGRPVPRLGDDALEALRAYNFPGNVRELENILERALALAEGEVLSAGDLRLPRLATQAPPGAVAPGAAPPPAGQPVPPGAVDPRTLNPRDTATSALPSYIEEIERAAIQQALQENRYNKTRTAAALGITFRALRYKLKKLGID